MAQARALADRLIPGEGLAWNAARVAAANLLLVLCAWVAIPLPWTPVPVTGQTFGVMLVAVLLGSRRGALTMALYLLEGLGGLPVFQPFGAPGPARLLGPTGGYLVSYPLAAFVTGWLAERGASASATRLAGALVAGESLVFAVGCAWLGVWLGMGHTMDWREALRQGALPFLPGELIKMALVVAAVRGVEFARRNG